MKRSVTHVSLLVLVALRMIVLSSCANIIPPGGGDIDKLPPRLVMALPRDSSRNVTTQNVTLVFDEYVTLDNVLSNLIISPTLKYIPQVDSKLRNVTIRIKDTLDPNTTYLFDFGDAVKDVNEGNIARGLKYVFSTGSTIDFNTYSGKVVLAETGKIDSNLIVMLHRNLSDSAVAKEKPRYYTRLNGNGEFTFYNLPPGEFAVYALSKGVYNNVYRDTSNLFAFLNTPVRIGSATRQDTLYAYQGARKEVSQSQSTLKLPNKDDKRLRYTTDFDNGQQDILNDLHLSFLKKLATFDSSKIVLYDTGFRRLNGYGILLDSTKTSITLKYPWKEATAYQVIIAKDAVADSLGNTLTKADTLRFFSKKEADYGSIRIRFTNLDLSKNPVLQFTQSERVVDSFPLSSGDFARKMYRPGTYDLRILYDTNKNGVWDPGNFFRNRRQPEIVRSIPRQLVIRANWDNEVTITL
jgi:hypothetical protein